MTDDNTETLYFTDTAPTELEYAGEGTLTTDNFNPSNVETVARDGAWTDFFDTTEFVQFDATVAQPIVQPYAYHGKLAILKKDEQELKRSQSLLQHTPWTLGHPDAGHVESTDEIRGFWTTPRWQDGQKATLNIPAGDTEAIQYAIDSDGVSPGFSSDVVWNDDASVKHDGVQTNIVYDHVASVDNPRCSPEQGCGLHTDDMDPSAFIDSETAGHGHIIEDSVQTPVVEDADEWTEGDWVAFHAEGERHHGKLTYVDAERALVKRYEPDDEELTDETTAVATSSLSSWEGPFTDSCEGICHCGCHDGPFVDNAPDGIYVTDGQWFAIAPDEHGDESTNHADDAKYPVNDCGDVQDAYDLVEDGDYDVEQSTLEARIKRVADAHGCPSEYTPWTDSLTDDTDTDIDDTMTSIHEFIDENDITREEILDSLNVEIPDEPIEFYDGEPDAETLAEDFGSVQMLLDSKEDLEKTNEELQDSLHEYRKEEVEGKVESLTDITDAWGDAEDLLDEYEETDDPEAFIDSLDDKIAAAKDIAGSTTTTVNDSADNVDDPDSTDQSGPHDLRERTA